MPIESEVLNILTAEGANSKVKDAANRADSACYTLRPLTLFKWQVAEMNKRPRMTGSEKISDVTAEECEQPRGFAPDREDDACEEGNKRNPAVAKAAMTAKTYCGPPDQAKLL